MRSRIKEIFFTTLIVLAFFIGDKIIPNKSPTWDETIRTVYHNSLPSVVTITATSSKEKTLITGAGIIISPNGEILTAYHLVDNPKDKIFINYCFGLNKNGRPLYFIAEAKIIGTAPWTDLALLKIKARNLRAIPIGTAVQISEPVMAIGHPFGHNMPTLGIVSHAAYWAAGHYSLLTDAAINPGNSGGPLINMRGELVGINVLTFYRYNGTASGIGGAVSSEDILTLLPRMRAHEKIVIGYLGVNFDDPTGNNFPVISEIIPDSEAKKSDLRVQDIILAIDGKITTSVVAVEKTVSFKKTGEKMILIIKRGKQLLKIAVLAERGETHDNIISPPSKKNNKNKHYEIMPQQKRAEDGKIIPLP